MKNTVVLSLLFTLSNGILAMEVGEEEAPYGKVIDLENLKSVPYHLLEGLFSYLSLGERLATLTPLLADINESKKKHKLHPLENHKQELKKLLREVDKSLSEQLRLVLFKLSSCEEKEEVEKEIISLIRQGIVSTKRGITPLMWAALMGKKNIVEALIQAKANVNEQGDKNHTALAYALANPDMVKLLLTHGADYTVVSSRGTIFDEGNYLIETASTASRKERVAESIRMIKEHAAQQEIESSTQLL